MKQRVNVPFWLPLTFLHLVSSGYTLFTGYNIEHGYTQLKSMLTEKYGKPARSVEKFHDYYSYPNTDFDKMYCLQFDMCTYYAQFELEKGEILLSLDTDGYVALQYWDKINTDLVKQDAINDL